MAINEYQPNEFQSFCTELFVVLSSEGIVDGIQFSGDTCTITKGSAMYSFSRKDTDGCSLDDFLKIVKQRFPGG